MNTIGSDEGQVAVPEPEISLFVESAYGTFRKSYARSFGETYYFPPPSTLYGMLLSLVGEFDRRRYLGVKLGTAYERLPKVATVIQKLSRVKYGVSDKIGKKADPPDYVQAVCGVRLHLHVAGGPVVDGATLAMKVRQALTDPASITRSGPLYLGVSDDGVNLRLLRSGDAPFRTLRVDRTGPYELPVWVDHEGTSHATFRRFRLAEKASPFEGVSNMVTIGPN